jgi:DNA-binding transcriptional regulator YbjK
MSDKPDRRALIADAAIEVLAREGSRGLTHRAVDRLAGLPAGTTGNYHPSREALLAAAAQRITAVRQRDTEALRRRRPAGQTLGEALHALVAAALTTHRARALAVLDLMLESARRPALAEVMRADRRAQERIVAELLTGHGALASPENVTVVTGWVYGTVLSGLTPGAAPDEAEVELADLAEAVARRVLES